MSQYNEIYGLSGINIFNDITDTTEYHDDGTIEVIYKAKVMISPTNRLHATATIGSESTRIYNSSVHILKKNESVYNSLVKIKVNNNLFIKLNVSGGGDKLYRARVISWDDRNKLYNALVTISVPDIRPERLYNATVNIQPPLYQNNYKSLVTISPRTTFEIGYNMFKGNTSYYQANITTSKEAELLYKARFVINPTNRLIAIGNISGYYESIYNATVKIKSDKSTSYRATVKVALGSSMYIKMEILDTPKHLFYGDLKKDAHVVETVPNANYGGLDYLYMNDKTMVFMEWNFSKNLDEFYAPNLEYDTGLKINIRKAIPTKSIGRVYLVNNNWEEYSITYNNKPADLDFIREFEIPGNFVGELTISLGNYLIEYAKEYPFTISLAVEIDSPIDTYSNSKETNVMIPALYYAYWYIPPNNRQTIYRAKVTIGRAYGKGNGIDTEFPALGEENPWSRPAKIWKCIFSRALEVPDTIYRATVNWVEVDGTKIYKCIVKIPTTDVDHAYKAIFFNYNPAAHHLLARSKVKVPKYDVSNKYNAYLDIPERWYFPVRATFEIPLIEKINMYNATASIPISEKEINYHASVTIKRAYGKGNGIDTEFPALGEENPWSRPAKIWYATTRVIRAYGKGNGVGTEFPALGEQKPWSRPAKIWIGGITIGINEIEKYYNANFFNDATRYLNYKAFIKILTYDNEHHYNATTIVRLDRRPLYKAKVSVPRFIVDDTVYNATVDIRVPEVELYNSLVNIPLFDNTKLYMATHRVMVERIELYNANIYIIPDRTNVHIFIM